MFPQYGEPGFGTSPGGVCYFDGHRPGWISQALIVDPGVIIELFAWPEIRHKGFQEGDKSRNGGYGLLSLRCAGTFHGRGFHDWLIRSWGSPRIKIRTLTEAMERCVAPEVELLELVPWKVVYESANPN